MLFLASMGETGISHDIFFKFSHRPFEVVEVEWQSNCDLEMLHLFLKVWLLTLKRYLRFVCMTNGSKVLIYFTLLYFISYCTLASNVKGNIAKSSKTKLHKSRFYSEIADEIFHHRLFEHNISLNFYILSTLQTKYW